MVSAIDFENTFINEIIKGYFLNHDLFFKTLLLSSWGRIGFLSFSATSRLPLRHIANLALIGSRFSLKTCI